MSNEALLPIRTVSALTGVNAVTLRAWERRYGLVRPKRTPKGQRLYTQAHVEEIQRVLALMRTGVAIGQVRAALAGDPRARGDAGAGAPEVTLMSGSRATVFHVDDGATTLAALAARVRHVAPSAWLLETATAESVVEVEVDG